MKDGARHFSVGLSDRTRESRNKLKHRKVYQNIRQENVQCKGGQVLPQAAPRGCGDTQNLIEHDHRQHDPDLGRRLTGGSPEVPTSLNH